MAGYLALDDDGVYPDSGNKTPVFYKGKLK